MSIAISTVPDNPNAVAPEAALAHQMQSQIAALFPGLNIAAFGAASLLVTLDEQRQSLFPVVLSPDGRLCFGDLSATTAKPPATGAFAF